jgi:hypothetical protein
MIYLSHLNGSFTKLRRQPVNFPSFPLAFADFPHDRLQSSGRQLTLLKYDTMWQDVFECLGGNKASPKGCDHFSCCCFASVDLGATEPES